MTIRLDALDRWRLVAQGEILKLPGTVDGLRKVRLHLNCEDTTWVYVSYAELDGVAAQFLAVAGPGPETIEFHAEGDLLVSFAPGSPDGEPSQVWLYTAELEPNVEPNPNAVTFTEIMTRRARNPELEMMQAIARHNQRQMEATLDQQAANIARLEALMMEKAVADDKGTIAKPAGGEASGTDPHKAGAENGSGGGKQQPVTPLNPGDGDGASGDV